MDPHAPNPNAPDPRDPDLLERLGHSVEDAVGAAERTVEQVEEKVEHALDPVVEHLPEPARRGVRWTVARLVVLVLASVLTLVVVGVLGVAYYMWNHTEYASHELTDRINDVLRRRSDVELSLDGLSGNPLTTVVVRHPRIRFRGAAGPPLLEADAMRLRYSTWDLLWGRRGAMQIEMDHPVVRLTRGADGKMRIPVWRAGAPSRGRPRSFDFELTMRNGEVHSPGGDLDTRGLNVNLRFATDPATLDLRSLRWAQGPAHTRDVRLSGTLAVTDSVVIALRRLQSPDFDVTGRAAWRRGEEARRVHADVRRLRWRWLGRAVDNGTLDVDGQGHVAIEATGRAGEWRGGLNVTGVWEDLDVTASSRFLWGGGRVQLEELRGTTAAGRIDGRVFHARTGWWIEGEVRDADPSQWGVIGIDNWPAGRLNGHLRYTVDTRRAKRAHLEAQLVGSEWSGWRTDSATVAVVFPPAPPVRFDVRAVRRGGVMTLHGDSRPGGWEGTWTASDFPLDEWPDGRASGLTGVLGQGSGTVRGADGTLDVTGALTGRTTDWLGARFAGWALDSLSGRLLPQPDLRARARLEDVMFLGIHLDHAASPFHLAGQTVSFQDFNAFAGDTLIGMDGRGSWDAAGWSFEASRAAMRSAQFDWRADGPVALRGDRQGVTFERLVARDQNATLAIAGRWGVPGGSWDWRATGTGLDLARLGLPREWDVAGRADATLAIEGPVGQARWGLDVRAWGTGARGRIVDSLEARAGGGPSRLEVERARVWLSHGHVDLTGTVSGMARPWADTLSGPAVFDWVARASRWDGRVEVDGLPLAALRRFVPALEPWRGTVGGSLALSGRPGAPELRVETELAGLGWRDLALDSLGVEAEYRDERLEVRQLGARRGGERWRASGTLPLRLALGSKPELPDRPVDFELLVPNGDLAVMPRLVPQVGFASGVFAIDAHVGGTARRPEVRGVLRVHDGRVRLAGRDEIIERLRASLRFTEQGLTLDSLSGVQLGQQRQPGTVAGSGEVRLAGRNLRDYRFQLALRNFTAVDPLYYIANLDGDFTVTNGPRVRGQVLPLVTSDNVRVNRAVIFYDFANQSQAQMVAASTSPLQWVYDINLVAKNNLHWSPSEADIEFDADLRVQQTPDSLLVYGDLHALRGWYDFFSNRFAIRRADLTFDDVEGLDPVLDIEATTRVKASAVEDAGESGSYDVTVAITGRSKEPDIQFSSTPDLSEEQVLQALTVGVLRSTEGRATAARSTIDTYLTRQLNRQLSGEMAKLFRGYINEVEIDREGGLFAGTGDIYVSVNSPITSNVTVRYREYLPGTSRSTELTPSSVDLFDRDIQAEYRLNRFIYLTSGMSQRRSATNNPSSVPAGPEYNVAIRARWEY